MWTPRRREPGRARAVRPGPAASPRVRVRARRVRRAGELHARGRDPRPGPTGRHRARSLGARPLLRSRRARTVRHSRARLAPTWASTRAPAPSTSHASAPATFPVASRSREFLPSLPARSTWCSCSRPCSPSRDKEPLLQAISRALRPGGRFAFTMEEGLPLTEAERERMPDADTVWLTPLEEMLTCLERAGLVVRWQEDCSSSHRAVADSLITAFAADAADHRRADRAQGAGGAAGRPPALERLAAGRTGPQDRVRRGEGINAARPEPGDEHALTRSLRED